MNVYVVINVSYDYYRFEEVIGVYKTKEKALKSCESFPRVLDYDVSEVSFPEGHGTNGFRHIWIREMKLK